MDKDDEKRDEVLKRLLKTPPKPRKSPKVAGDRMRPDNPEVLAESSKSKDQGDD